MNSRLDEARRALREVSPEQVKLLLSLSWEEKERLRAEYDWEDWERWSADNEGAPPLAFVGGAGIGTRLQETRTAQALGLQELGALTGLTQTTIKAIERGIRTPSVREVLAIQAALAAAPTEESR